MPQEIELVPVKKKEREIELTPIERVVIAPSPAQLPEELKPTKFPEALKRFLRKPEPPRKAEIRALRPEEREREIELVEEEKALPRYWEKRMAEVQLLPTVVPEELKLKKVEKIIDVPGQALTHAANNFFFGIPGFLHKKISGESLPAPKTEIAGLAGGLGGLGGIIGPGQAVSQIPIVGARLARGLKGMKGVAPFEVTGKIARKIFGPPSNTMVGRFIQNTMQMTTTLGLANGVVTWEGDDAEAIVANKLDAMASGMATGAVFGATPWLKLSSAHPTLSNLFRIGMGSAVIDVIHGQTPFDDRSVMQKAYDYGLNIYFLRHGAPEMKAKTQVKKLATEAKAFNRQAEIDGFEVRLPDTVEKIMAELKKEGFDLEFIKPTKLQLAELPIRESDMAKQTRLRHERPEIVDIDAQAFQRAFEETHRDSLAWSESRLNLLRGVQEFSAYPEVDMTRKGTVDVTDGRHRIALAAERGLSIKVAMDKADAMRLPLGIRVKPVKPEGSAPLYQPKDTRDPLALQMEENILKLDTAKKEDVRRVQGFYDKSRKEIAAREKKGFGDVVNWISTQFIDLTGRTQRMLIKKGGALGREASIRADLARSAPTVADYEVDNWSKRIYRGLSLEQEKILNDAIASRSVMGIQKKVRHPGGLTKEQHLEYSRNIPQEINDRADVFFSAMRRPLVLLKQEGIISQTSFDNLSKRQDYSPRWFIDAVDPPALDSMRRKADINVRDSGLKKLGKGDIGIIEQNSRLFLREVYGRTWSRVLKNRSNRALLEMARELPDNGVVKLAGKGRPPVGQEQIIAWEDGKPQRMWVPEDMAKSWALSDPQTTQALAHVVQWLTGTKILKAFATGYNPAFAITNMPRDLALIWMSTPEYSSFLPKAGFQMAADLIATAPAAFKRKGPYIDYIKEGGGIQFLTKQGQATRATGKWKQLQSTLGYVGETSEIWSRLAVRRRSLINGKEPYEATWTARNYLDFSKGGPIIKAVDNAIPYLNASIQASRGIFRAFRDRPAQSAWKVAQVGTLAMGLYYANRYLDPEGWESLSDKTKARYWCLFTPFQYKDKKGNTRRLYLKIAKDQGQRVFTAIFEAMATKSVGDMVDGDYVSGVVRDAMPLMPETALPPMLEALLGYSANKDFWYNDDIWRGAEVDPKEEWTHRTSLLARQFGKIGLSPTRAERALQQVFTTSNFYTDALGFGVRTMLGELPEMQKQQTMQQIMLDMPIINRIFTSTSPHEFRYSQIEDEKIRQNTARWQLTREFDYLLEQHLQAKKEADGADEASLQQMQDFLKGKPPVEIQRLLTRWTNTEKLFGTKYKAVWKSMLGMSPESRAKIFYHWWSDASEKQKKGIQKDLAGLAKTGFFSDRFWIEYAKFMGGKNEENR